MVIAVRNHAHPDPRRGYILLTVLLLLALAAVATAAVCRVTLRRATDATAAADELQRRWGMLSCRRALLTDAENVLAAAETPGGPAVTRVHLAFDLGRDHFDVDLCDEQSKNSVNEIYGRLGRDNAERLLKQLTGGAVRLRPAVAETVRRSKATDSAGVDDEIPTRPPAVFGSWAEVVPVAGWGDLVPSRAGSPANFATLWGDGRLNILRASEPALAAVCSPVLSPEQIGQLRLIARTRGERMTVGAMLDAVHATTADGFTLTDRLTTVSTTHSIWIEARDRSGVDREAVVRDGSDPDDVRIFVSRW